MRVARRGAWIVTALLTAAACAPDPGVEAERSRPLPTVPVTEPTSSSTATTTTTVAPPTTTEPLAVSTSTPAPATSPPSTEPIDPDDPFAALEPPSVDVPATISQRVPRAAMSLVPLPISATSPPGGFNGFRAVARMGNGALLATGFDAAGDGVQAEPSALWTSVDGLRWVRIGLELSAPPGQQSHSSVVVDGNTTYVVGTDLGIASLAEAERAVAYVARSEDFGQSWTSETIANGSLAVDATLTAGGLLVLTVDISTGVPRTVLMRKGAAGWEPTLMASGSAGTGADAWAASQLLTIGQSLIAIGTRNDGPVTSPTPPLEWIGTPGAEVDVAMWRSDDAGATWAPWLDSGFAGIPGSQSAVALADAPGGPLVVVADSSGPAAAGRAGYQFSVFQYVGDGWQQIPVDLGCESEEYLTTAQIVQDPLLPGIAVVIASCISVRRGFVVEVTTTLIDLQTGESDTQSVTADTEFQQVESVLEVAGSFWLFGRLERGDLRSDLQIMELRLAPAA